ncbi:mechanosensitive ion channel family protein [Croceitalea sp. MTPC9]|uniref:mechanosensitive ion channel domain-containing protein n=1 Tax=unclassified Croceitalea TaxID=2632280 RepID=UPI002B3E6C50|nr:mechanosensitive ion channel family protein [Croceitalea sp. MTPC6]GMN15920.1 mechanosensitive ion channel family protein [Croceitalea sp. MTPC9]
MIALQDFINDYQSELIGTLIGFAVFLILRFLAVKTIRRVGRISDINQVRTVLVGRYITFALFILLLISLLFIWKVNFKELGLIVSSVFAVIGVALFATWSILSNVTAGIILFFYFPFKIGDRIRILDKDFPEEAIIIDIQAFTVNLKKDNGELLTYPNNLLLQKGVVLIQKEVATGEDLEQHF